GSLVTPHAWIAQAFPGRAILLDWQLPTATPRSLRNNTNPLTILFPAATLARKGAYEVRQAIAGTPTRILLGGPIHEAPDFWSGIEHSTVHKRYFDDVDAVVLPAIAESQPRALLQAIASNVPVIATPQTGLHADSPVIWVEALNAATVRNALNRIAAAKANAINIGSAP
ncbi:MAG TPA: glycosyltransferase, partial [Acidobacteriaceae bacterium]|nr:glycosyltransferase [Acidobacteriaceae bacterium]